MPEKEKEPSSFEKLLTRLMEKIGVESKINFSRLAEKAGKTDNYYRLNLPEQYCKKNKRKEKDKHFGMRSRLHFMRMQERMGAKNG